MAPASIATSRPSANGKNASDATTEPLVSGAGSFSFLRGILRLARGDARGIDAAHLAGADADGGAVLGIDDGVRLHVLGDAEGKAQIGELGVVGARLVTILSCMSSTTALSRDCTSKPPATDFTVKPAGARIGQAAGEQQPQILLRRDDRDRLLGRVGRDDHLGENLGDGARRLGIERAVERDDAAEGRRRIAGQRLAIGVEQSSRLRRRRRDWRA